MAEGIGDSSGLMGYKMAQVIACGLQAGDSGADHSEGAGAVGSGGRN
jgi:hypothetical protein